MTCNCKNTDELRIVRGNAFAIRLTVSAIHIDGTPVENFVLGDAEAVLKVMHLDAKTPKDFLIIGNDAIISFGGDLSLGWYGFEMTGTFNGKPWRWCVPQVFQVVETNAKANIPAWAVLTDETYSINGVMTITSGDIYQSDWDETDPQSPSYIKNKPDVVLHPEFNQTVQRIDRDIDAEEIRAKSAEKQNADDIDTIEGKIPAAASSENKLVDKQQMDNATADFITKSVNDLVNYYLKSDTYTKSEVQQLIAAVKQFTYEVVQTLPTASASTMNKIYLVPSTNPETKNVKDEYITIATETEEGGETVTTYSWEQIGSTTVDLSGYYTSAQTDTAISNALTTALADYSTTSEMNTAITNALNTALADYSTTTEMTAAIAAAIANYYTKSEVDSLIANFITKSVNDLVNYYLKSDTYTKSEVQQLIAAVKQFTYEVVQTLPTASASTMNKIYLVPSTNPKTENVKDEFITIATEAEEGGETVTTYSWEQIGSTTVDLSGYYTSAQTDTAISNALTTALADYSTTSEMNTAITNALNTALADYSTTTEMTAAIATAIANYYTKSEVDALIANFITKSVNDLVNYYLKSDTYTKSEVQQLIAAVKQFTYEVVQTLPTASASTMNKIYLVPSTNPKTENVKDEFITIATEAEEGGETVTTYSWEQIGSTTVDLSGYYTSAQTDTAISNALTTALADYSTTTELTTLLGGKADKVSGATNGNLAGLDSTGNLMDSGYKPTDFANAVNITYTELKALRDGSGLNPGQFYRITDYVTTTVQTNTRSAGHRFDVIVVALTNSSLSEEAWACKHDYPDDYIPEDTSAEDYQEKYDEVHYFDGIPLEAWELRYCLDNDTDRFRWAVADKSICVPMSIPSEQWWVRDESADSLGDDYPYAWKSSSIVIYTATENPAAEDMAYDNSIAASVTASGSVVDTCDGGKGVIYRMIDDRNNDLPYDFKNILMTRWQWSNEIIMPASYINDATYNYFGVAAMKQIADMVTVTSSREKAPLLYGKVGGNPVFGSTLTESYVNSNLEAVAVDSSAIYIPLTFQVSSSNVYATLYVKAAVSASSSKVLCKNMYTFHYGSNNTDATVSLGKHIVYSNKIGVFVNSQKFTINHIVFVIQNTSNPNVYNNEIGENSYNLTFGQNTSNNKITESADVIFGYNCKRNKVELVSAICFSQFNYNTIGYLAGIVVNSYCRWNRINSNSIKLCFGKHMESCAFETVQTAIFGDDCRYLTIGSNCFNLYFGDDIRACVFDNSDQHIIYGTDAKNPQSHLEALHLSTGNVYLKINCTDTTSTSLKCRRIDIPKIVNYNSTYLQIDVAAGNDFNTTFELSTDVVTQITPAV